MDGLRVPLSMMLLANPPRRIYKCKQHLLRLEKIAEGNLLLEGDVVCHCILKRSALSQELGLWRSLVPILVCLVSDD
jgi:hypothetical protein